MRFIGIVMFATAAALSCSPGLAQVASSPLNDYRKLTCLELAQEGRAISQRGFTASGLKAGPGGSDGTQTAPAIVIVWPETALDHQPRSGDLARAFRQMDAIEQASIEGQCSIRFQRSPAG